MIQDYSFQMFNYSPLPYHMNCCQLQLSLFGISCRKRKYHGTTCILRVSVLHPYCRYHLLAIKKCPGRLSDQGKFCREALCQLMSVRSCYKGWYQSITYCDNNMNLISSLLIQCQANIQRFKRSKF